MKAERSPEPAHPIDHRIARGMQILRCLLIRTAAKYRSENPVIERITAGKFPQPRTADRKHTKPGGGKIGNRISQLPQK